jgi:SrtB family sortase
LYDGTRGKAGTPFLDYENASNFSDRNSIIYGHNLLDGSMFSCLAKYADQAYYDAHPSMSLLTPSGNYSMEIFAAFVVKPGESGSDTSPWRQDWETNADFAAWLAQMKDRSVVHTGAAPTAEDRVLTLSTCVHRGRDRFIVMGKLTPAA